MPRVVSARPTAPSIDWRACCRPTLLGGMDRAVTLLMQAIAEDKRIVIAGDYDCDGATGTAVAERGLRLLGARHVSHVVPNRFVHGYGLSEALVASLEPAPDFIVTVDNGVASVAGVAAARARGISCGDHRSSSAGRDACLMPMRW